MNVKEYEWIDEFGKHYEVRGIGPSGRIYSQKVMTLSNTGWGPKEREQAYGNVTRAIAAETPALAPPEPKHPHGDDKPEGRA